MQGWREKQTHHLFLALLRFARVSRSLRQIVRSHLTHLGSSPKVRSCLSLSSSDCQVSSDASWFITKADHQTEPLNG
ncbi:hypothetical protein PCANC_16353 [Puccinia coronata f. sp. avenae]|uniref:Secreted protein n=1 Tax=Puccinia coronata f. sp. avenae TaxID=200324 RepID=A0A2N5UQN0_9BASI|nr:hypothetical protein PCANC_16353 [Puccinia coronata f. sp. avenae]